MDELVDFLPRAQWREKGQHTSICNDENLKSVLVKFRSGLPDSLKGYELQAWKTTGNTKVKETVAYLIPILIIEGTARIINGPLLVPGSKPIYFNEEIIISGNLYYVLAYPPKSD
ncbi:hypothetical protein BDW59DRAFT_155366 [Aspergillus cavernicola]|uniref:Uncharacterized protein n=1 Tax=Aspergillus cavernicola TaxID=176166 RepID=A0ABR4H9I2_9EURO